MVFMPTPAPVASPMPMPSGWPSSNASDPRFGTNPYSGSSESSLPAGIGLTPTPTKAINAVAGTSAAPGMSPTEAENQTAAALAKLATVNPQLAQQLLEQREGSDSGGFMDFLGDVAGAIFSPVLSIGGKALEIIGRTSHIVPQWFDPEDEGSWLADIGQALSGEDKTTWSEVMENRGILEGAGWLRATLGFIGDVATDPLTYATLGASAGVSAGVKATTIAKTLATKVDDISQLGKLAMQVTGKNLDEAGGLLQKAYKFGSGQTENMANLRNFADGGADEITGLIARNNQSELRALVADRFELASIGHRMVVSRQWKKFINSDEALTLSSGSVVRAKDIKPMFEAIARAKPGRSFMDESWQASKAAAGAMGGLRFRYSIPFTQFRYMSPMVPYSHKLGLGAAGRFGAGLSAISVVSKMGREAEQLFSEVGWKGLKDVATHGSATVNYGRKMGTRTVAGNKKLAADIIDLSKGGRIPFVRSAFWQASDRVGQMTAALTPGARMYRRGLNYTFLRSGVQAAKDTRKRLTTDLFYSVLDEGHGEATRTDLYNRLDAAGIGQKPKVSPDQMRDVTRYVENFGHKGIPSRPEDLDNGNYDNWFWTSTPERQEAKFRFENADAVEPGLTKPGEVDYNRYLAQLDEAKRVYASLDENQRRAVEDLVATEAFGKLELERHGVDVGDAAVDLEEVRVLHPDDINPPDGSVGVLGARTQYLAQEFQAVLPEGVFYQTARNSGVSRDFEIAHEQLGIKGVLLDLEEGAGRAGNTVPVQLKIQNIHDVHLEDYADAAVPKAEAVIGGEAGLPEILKAVDMAMDAQGEALAAKLHPLLDNAILRTEWDAATRAELATDVLRARPDKPDAVRFFREGKPVSMVVFDHKKAFVPTPSAPFLQPKNGYFRRTLSPALRAKLRGEGEIAGRRIFGDPGRVDVEFRRATRNMNLEEAERHIREMVNNDNDRWAGITIGPNEDVFEWDVLKAHEDYVKYLGDSYFEVATGRLTQRMLDLGNLVPAEFGGMLRTERARFEMPLARMQLLSRAEKFEQNAAVKLDQLQSKEIERTAKGYADLHDRVATAIAYMDAGFEGGDIPAVRMATSIDNAVRSSANLQKVVFDTEKSLAKREAVLAPKYQTIQAVEDALHVDDWKDLDEFIKSRKATQMEVMDAQGNMVPDEVQFMTKADQVHEAELLKKAQLEGRAANVSPPERSPFDPLVWRVESGIKVGDEFLPRRLYLVEDPVSGEILHVRELDMSNLDPNAAPSVIAQTAKGQEKRGLGMRAIMAHWRDEGVETFADVKRVIGENTFSEGAIKLNLRAARNILREKGFVDPDHVKDLLRRGELYVGKDQTILTKKLGYRNGGTKVIPRDELDAATLEIAEMRTELAELRKGEGVTQGQKAGARRFATAAEKTEKAVAQNIKGTAKAAVKHGKQFEKAKRRVQEAFGEWNRAQAEVQGHWAEMKPAVVFDTGIEGGYVGLREVQIPGLGGIHAHPYVAEELEYLFKGRPTGALGHAWRQFVLGPWKRWATYRNPGFHVRNNFGAWFNNMLGGVQTKDYQFSSKLNMARGRKKDFYDRPIDNAEFNWLKLDTLPGMEGRRGQVTYGEISDMLADQGIGRANTTAIAEVMGGDGLVPKARGKILGGFSWADRRLKNIGGTTEDFHRVAAWSAGMRTTDGDLYGAHAFTMVRHGDYSDLTELEDKIRDLVPFYKWMRTNVPYQFRMLAENPGMFATLDKAQTFAYDVQGLDRYYEERSQPEWMKRSFNIPIPKGTPIFGSPDETNYLMFDLPYTDLYSGAREYLSSGLPVFRNIIESYGIEQQVFTGAPLGAKMVKPAGIFQAPGIKEVIAATPWAEKGADGDIYIPDTLDNMLAAMPVYSRYRNWLSADPARVENRMGTIASAIFGVGLRSEDATATELSFYYDELLPTMDRLKSMGYTFPTVDQLREAGAMYDDYGQFTDATSAGIPEGLGLQPSTEAV